MAVLNSGYHDNFNSAIASFRQGSFATDFYTFPNDLIETSKVLVIPSGGLYGMENSAFFKATLDEYVKQGGTLIVFAQQHGYEFNILPVPQEPDGTYKIISGYGWQEDQSCFWNSAYIENYHQILAGMSRSTPTLNIDGYFTNYPSNATILLRRTANGQPAMIMYEYGHGKVIVTSMYSDFAYGHSQASLEEIVLIRDMVSWAIQAEQLPEIKPGEAVSVPVALNNLSNTDASSVKVRIYTPDRSTLLSEQVIPVSIAVGQTEAVTVDYQSTSSSFLGIYHIDYILYDSVGNIIQPQSEPETGRFVVSNPPINPYKSPDYSFSVQSDSEQYVYGASAVFTFNLWNNTDVDREIKVTWWLYNTYQKVITVPAKGQASFSFILENIRDANRLRAKFYDESGTLVGYAEKGIWATYSSIGIQAKTDKTSYAKGEVVSVSADIKNNASAASQINIKTIITDPKLMKVFEDTKTLSMTAYEATILNCNFNLPMNSIGGTYVVRVEAWYGPKLLSSASKVFEIPQGRISIVPRIQSAITEGSNTILFILNNSSNIAINSGNLEATLKNPAGAVVFSGSQPFTLMIGESKILDIALTLPFLDFGDYTLTFAQSDETRIGDPITVTIPVAVSITHSLDKPSYRVGGTANLNINITNMSKFGLQGAEVSISIPDFNYTDTKILNLGIGDSKDIQYSIPIPETALAGQHIISLVSTLPSGSSMTSSSMLTIPESALSLEYSAPEIIQPETVLKLIIENGGGANTDYVIEKLTITDNKGIEIYNGTGSGKISAGDNVVLDIRIPDQTAGGFIWFDSSLKDIRTGGVSVFKKAIYVNGLQADLQIISDKPAYLLGESITSLNVLTNGAFNINSGLLNVKIDKFAQEPTFTEFLPRPGGAKPGSGDGEFYYPMGVAIDRDGYIYIVDSSNSRIQIFDSDGNFIKKWGNHGRDAGELYYPSGISISPDGFIYVMQSSCSADKNCVQKFDADGHFIRAWRIGGFSWFNYGITIAPDGSMYVTGAVYAGGSYSYKELTHGVWKYDSNGEYVTFWGGYGNGSGKFQAPGGIVASADGYVYVADTDNHRIQKFDSQGSFIASWGTYGSGDGQLMSPRNIKISPDGYIYVADSNNNRIQKFDVNGNFISKWGEFGVGNGQFYKPFGIEVSSDGSVYASDSDNHRIQKMRPPVLSGTLFETSIPVTQEAGTVQEYTISVGSLNTTGKLYLNSELKNNLGQTIAKSEYPFYIIEGTTALIVDTDKKVYRPGEIINIKGEVKNLASLDVSGLVLSLSQANQLLYSATFDIPAKGSHAFTFTTIAGPAGEYSITGVAVQNSMFSEVSILYDVADPIIDATILAPDFVGTEPFDINIEIKNNGKVDAEVNIQPIDGEVQTISVSTGETKVLQYSRQIEATTTYNFVFTGDLDQTLTKIVQFVGLGAQIIVNAATAYQEGRISIPVNITNSGQMDETLAINYNLSRAQNQTKTYYIPKGLSVNDTLNYDLTAGEYNFSANSSIPVASASATFAVKKINDIILSSSIGSQSGGLIPISVNLNNVGYNDFAGNLALRTDFYSTEETVAIHAICSNTPPPSCETRCVSCDPTRDRECYPSCYPDRDPRCTPVYQACSTYCPPSPPPCSTSATKIFNIDPSSAQPGDYQVNVSLFDNSGNVVASNTKSLTVKGALFSITQVPPFQTSYPGQEVQMSFKVKNIGNQEGAAILRLSVYDLLDSSKREWFLSGEEKTFSFTFALPTDLEEKDYFADYKLLDDNQKTITSGQIKYHLAGINIAVTGSLDKSNYLQNETARLTLNIQSSSNTPLPLFARVNYNSYSSQQSFILIGSQAMTFDISLDQITGEKLFYGIYSESGRSIHLNSVYIYNADQALLIATDKQVYNPSETVSYTISSQTGSTGTISISSNNYSQTVTFGGSAQGSFTLPSKLTAGTYYITAQLTRETGEIIEAKQPFDVNGIQVRVLECSTDKPKYDSMDTISIKFTISSNTNLSATLKAWIVDPNGRYNLVREDNISLTSSENVLFASEYGLSTGVSGIHQVVYGIYSNDLLLASGREAFDVGDAVLLGVTTEKTDYSGNSEPVKATFSLFGTVNASLDILLDGTPIKTEQVALNGMETLEVNIGIIEGGNHVLRGILKAGGLESTKETQFTYGSSLPDLVATLVQTSLIIKEDHAAEFQFMIKNQGRTATQETIAEVYENGTKIKTENIKSLLPDESQGVKFTIDVMGKAGKMELKSVSDADNRIAEFNEKNNTGIMEVDVPELALITSTLNPEYRIRQTAEIKSKILNLSLNPIDNHVLSTKITLPSGLTVFEESRQIGLLQPTSKGEILTNWAIPLETEEGNYAVTQAINSAGETVSASTASFNVLRSDFSISIDRETALLKQGEKASFTGTIEPLGYFEGVVNLRVEGLPERLSFVFSPSGLVPPGQFQFDIITNESTETGTFPIKLIAEGEGIIHELMLSVDISGFRLVADHTSEELNQLENATFNIDITALNGYQGSVSLTVNGALFGVMADLDISSVEVPDSVKLNVLTSKFVKPGIYELTLLADDGLAKHKSKFTIDIKPNPDIAFGLLTTEGPGPNNSSWLRALNLKIELALDLMPFDTKYGAYAASGDIDGDGYDEIIASKGPDPKNNAAFRLFNQDGVLLGEWVGADTAYGLTLSTGDLDSDWQDELVVGYGPDPKNDSVLKILKFNNNQFTEILSQVAYEDLKYGVTAALGDLDGDKLPEIITAPGPGPHNPALIKIWKLNGTELDEINSFTAFENKFYGANIASGDIDGDGNAEIVVGAGPDPKNPAVIRAYKADGSLIFNLKAFDLKYGYGVNVATVDVDNDGIEEIVAGLGAGPKNPSWVKIFKLDGTEVASFIVYPDNNGYGVRVYKGRPGE